MSTHSSVVGGVGSGPDGLGHKHFLGGVSLVLGEGGLLQQGFGGRLLVLILGLGMGLDEAISGLFGLVLGVGVSLGEAIGGLFGLVLGVGVSLGVMELLSLHGDVLSEVLISVHADGEELSVSGLVVFVGGVGLSEAIGGLLSLILGVRVGLSVMELLSLHGDVLSEIFVSVHADGEELLVRGSADNTVAFSLLASRKLNEASSRGPGLSPGGLVEVSRGIVKFDGLGDGDKGGD